LNKTYTLDGHVLGVTHGECGNGWIAYTKDSVVNINYSLDKQSQSDKSFKSIHSDPNEDYTVKVMNNGDIEVVSLSNTIDETENESASPRSHKKTLKNKGETVRHIAIDWKEKYLVSVYSDQSIKIWNIE